MILPIIYQDQDLIAVNKPPGLVSTPSETQATDTLADILNKEYGITLERGGLVHRLDKDTSGLIIAAKNQETFDILQSQFQERTVKKEYLALVHGFFKEDTSVEGAIARNPQNREKFTVDPNLGKAAVTEYKIAKHLQMSDRIIEELFEGFSKIQIRKLYSMNYPQFTLLNCFPQTGRTHQIRVHLKYINFPLVGDDKYGGRKTVRLDHRWCPRQFLHAAKIEFIHPKDKEKKISLETPLPDDLKTALEKLN